MAVDYVPPADNDFLPWAQQLSSGLTTLATDVGLTAADATALSTQVGTFASRLASMLGNQAAARTARQNKDAERGKLEEMIRGLVRRIQAHPGTTDGMRETLGITVRDATLTAVSSTSLDGHRATGWVDTSERLRHSIHFADIATPRSTAKPKGIKGCEIWRKIGAAPTFVNGQPVDLEFVALDTATPYVGEFSSADAGKTAYYVLRWISKDDSKGAWSETIEATVVG